jgi:hypothetical protein
MATRKKKVDSTESQLDPDRKLVDTIKKWRDSSRGLTASWEINQLKWQKMRMRIKKVKNFPFVGCANLRMPTIETKIRKLKASLVNVIFGIRPVVQVIPTPSGTFENAQKIEKFLDYLIMEKTDTKNKVVISVDQTLEKGWVCMKPFWAYEEVTRIENASLDDLSISDVEKIHSVNTSTEDLAQMLVSYFQADMTDNVKNVNMTTLRDAAEKIHGGSADVKVDLQEVTKNHPDADTCMDERIYVGTDSGYDPQGCQWVIHEFFMPLDTVKKNAELKGWDVKGVTEIWAMKQVNLNQRNIQIVKDFREGIMRLQTPDELVMIWEAYCWYDINGDGIKEKVVATLAPDFLKVLRKSTLPFYNQKWPFVKLFYELIDDRWFSHRGIPEMIEDIVKEIDIQHMQKIDSQTIRNSPMFMYRAGMINNKAVQFIFGQGIPVQGMTPLNDVMAPMNNQNQAAEFSYKDEQMILESKVEELLGQVDFTLQSMINKRQPRTLGEVNQQVQGAQTTFSLDAALFKGQIEELFNWYWDLWCQYGNDEEEFSYFGKDGWEKIRLNREEVKGKYKITVRGNDQNTNPQIRLQKAQAVMADMENPILMQSGVVTPINLANALKMKYQLMDIDNWQELVTFPQPKQQSPPPPPIKMNMLDLTPLEQAQVKQKFGIQPDMHGMALQQSQDLNAEGIAHEHAVIQEKHKANLAQGQMALQQAHEQQMKMMEMAAQQQPEPAGANSE